MASSKIKGITIEIGGETTKLGQALQSVESQTKSLQSELKGVNSLLKLDPSNVDLLKQKQDLLTIAISSTEEKLNTLKTTMSQISSGDITVTEEQYRDLQREIANTETKLKSLTDEQKSFGSVTAQSIAAAGDTVEKAGNKVESVGKTASIASAGIAAIGTASIAAFEEVDSGADDAIKKTGATGEAAKELEQSYKNVASTITGDFSDIGNAIGEVSTRLGFSGKSLETATTEFIKFAQVNNTDVSTAIQNVSRYMGDASIDSSQYATVLDNLTAAAQKSGINIDDLSTMLTQYGAPMRALGLTTQESIAIFAGWEKAGVNTEIAFSGMKKAISNWGSEGKNSAEEFKKTIQLIKDTPDIATATTKAIEVFGAKAGPDLADAIKGGRFEYEDFLKAIQNSKGTLDGTYDATIDGADDAKIAMQNAKIAFSDIGNTILTLLTPVLQKLSGLLKSFSDWWTNLSPEMQKIILIIAGIVAVVGPLLLGIGKLIVLIGQVMTFAPAIISTITAIVGAINWPIVAIVAVIAAIVLLWNKCEWFRNLIIGLWDGIKAVFQVAFEWLGSIFASIGNFFVSLWNIITSVFGSIATWFNTYLVQPIAIAFQAIMNFINQYIIQPLLSLWNDYIFPIVSKIIEIITKIVEIIFSLFIGIAIWVYNNVLKPIIDAIVSYYTWLFGIINLIWNFIVGIFSAVASWIYNNVIQPIINAINTFKTTAITIFTSIWDKITSIFGSVGSWFKDRFVEAYNAVTSVFSKIGSFFGGIWNSISDKFSSLGTTIGDAIGGAVKSGINGVISTIENIINGGIKLINGAINLINKLPGVNIGKIGLLSLPRLATGDVAMPGKPYYAMLGDNKTQKEVISPVGTMRDTMMDALTDFTNVRTQGSSEIQTLTNLMDKYMPQILSNIGQNIVLDDGTLVGKIAPKVDTKLGELTTNRMRGR